MVFTKQHKMLLLLSGLGIVVLGVTFFLWSGETEEEESKDEIELLAEEYLAVKCKRGLSATEAREAEQRTMEILGRLNEIVESKETSDEMDAAKVRVMDIIQTDCSDMEAS